MSGSHLQHGPKPDVKTPMLRGADVAIARMLAIARYAWLFYLLHALLTLAEFGFSTLDPRLAGWLFLCAHACRVAALLLNFVAASSLFFADAWPILPYAAIGLMFLSAIAGAGALMPFAPLSPANTPVAVYAAEIPLLLASTITVLLLRWLVGERNRSLVWMATAIALVTLWSSMASHTAYVNAACAIGTPPASETRLFVTWSAHLLSMSTGAVCLWLAVIWTQSDTIEIEPLPVPEEEEDESPGPWDDYHPEE